MMTAALCKGCGEACHGLSERQKYHASGFAFGDFVRIAAARGLPWRLFKDPNTTLFPSNEEGPQPRTTSSSGLAVATPPATQYVLSDKRREA